MSAVTDDEATRALLGAGPEGSSNLQGRQLLGAIRRSMFGVADDPGIVVADRYELGASLGAGGCGTVFRARDRTLERDVALKLLTPGLGPGTLSPDPDNTAEQVARTLCEARTLARLDHPNVVAVFDAGDHNGQVFLAMELVAGGTLRDWQREDTRPWREIVDRYVLAAEGLAAAHRAGLVHRDFKPANVLVGSDGRVRVADFGLAIADAKLTESAANPASPNERALLGTPAYMAPEQLEQQDCTARSDQYSFCVALYEAIYGSLPFSGESIPEIAAKKLSGELDPLPRVARVCPAWVRRVLLRGLQLQPDHRFSSLDTLIRALDWRRRRRQRVGFAGLVTVASLGFGAASLLASRPCEAQQLPWTDGDRQALAATVSGARDGPETAEKILEPIDGWVDDWRESHQAACASESAQSGEMTPAQLERRSCLDQQAASFHRLKTSLAAAPAEVSPGIASAVEALGPPGICANRNVSVPDARPGLWSYVGLRGWLFPAQALGLAGMPAAALPIVEHVSELATAWGDEHVAASANLLRGRLLRDVGRSEDAERVFTDAAAELERLNQPSLALAASADLVHTLAVALGRPEEAVRRGRIARDRLESSANEDARWRFDEYFGVALTMNGEAEDAIRLLEPAFARHLEAANPVGTIDTGLALANAQLMIGKTQDAVETLDRLAAGADISPRTASYGPVVGTRCNALMEAERWEEAEPLAAEALSWMRTNRGPHHPNVAISLMNQGKILMELDRLEPALKSLRAAKELATEVLGKKNVLTASAMMILAEAELAAGEIDAAAATAEEAALSMGAVLDLSDPRVAQASELAEKIRAAR